MLEFGPYVSNLRFEHLESFTRKWLVPLRTELHNNMQSTVQSILFYEFLRSMYTLRSVETDQERCRLIDRMVTGIMMYVKSSPKTIPISIVSNLDVIHNRVKTSITLDSDLWDLFRASFV